MKMKNHYFLEKLESQKFSKKGLQNIKGGDIDAAVPKTDPCGGKRGDPQCNS